MTTTMKNRTLRIPLRPSAALTLALAAAAGAQAAGFVDDATGSLTLRNFYIHRNFVDDRATRSKAEEWTQNFLLDLKSGYTEGPLGFGLDVLGLYSFKLDGGKGTGGTQLLPLDHDGKPADQFGRLAVSGKLKFSETELRAGEWSLVLPILRADDGRSLPQTFRGSMLTSREIPSLTLHAGHITGNSPRDDGSMEDMTLNGTSPYTSDRTSDDFDFAGAEYAFNGKRTSVGLWYARLKDIYKQRYVQLQHSQPLGKAWTLDANLGYFDGEEDGEALEGHLDNKTLTGMFSLRHGAHTFYLGLQRVSGDSKWLRVNGTSGGSLANDSYNGSFDNARERSWQVRYDYDFAPQGVPGLTLMTRYIEGHNVHTGNIDDGEEWNRETQLSYVVQSGPAKNLALRWRNSTIRRDWGADNEYDEQRIIVQYPLSLF
ncbi:OprD family outer membrane porin [Azotobacter vinelandii CA]|uniref:OprD family outer membrane porin n=2 Tax=Azotobacter vinelandii TaxID=354 RepID=C1DL33_AZOVD|nr:OprD family porin [Azotobacter vinelandii]ACO81026.1 OprD family outer membrane porin [Azotobacter vinelandii DJ]AGK14196.1 OprD family outer membrane porin [Azotobacter vinelandii CA]AGK22306.1 OprD family outer membrane porin [Azotobacter vinelandii CA6]